MQKVYLDCDGVILDTINKSNQMILERNLKEEEEIKHFYSTLNWKKLITSSGEIDSSIEKIKVLANHFDVEILTHVNSEKEVSAKREYFSRVLPDIKVITVPWEIKKADFIEPKNTILVDDYKKNLIYWKSKGGIPVHFTRNVENDTYPAIADLLDLIDLYSQNKIEVKE